MNERMYQHMKNTLRDIKTEINRTDLDDKTKVRYISIFLKLLESVECGEVVLSNVI